MADVSINVSVDGLRKFSKDLKSFNKDILVSCSELMHALKQFRQSVDENTVYAIAESTTGIIKVVSDAEPDLLDLSKRVEAYANFVEQLVKQANG